MSRLLTVKSIKKAESKVEVVFTLWSEQKDPPLPTESN